MIKNHRFKKHLGQNFVSDTNFLNSIVADAGVTKNDSVLEIGAGAGTLTEALANAAKKVVAIEKDEDLKNYLEEKFNKDAGKVQLMFCDFLKTDKKELEKDLDKPYKIVANLPYYITTPIIFKIIEEEFNASSLTIMVQKEVAQRLIAKPATKEYGVITVKLNAISDISITRQAPRALFYPQPNVDSAVIKIDFKNKINVKAKIFNKVVDCAFKERRKMLAGNLAREFKVKKEDISKILTECGIDPQTRGESLDYNQFAKIAQKLSKL